MKIRNILITLTALIACLCFSPAAQAEFYQYTDDNGVVHYTDDYSTIPKPYQTQIDAHPETPKDSPSQAGGTEEKNIGQTEDAQSDKQFSPEALEQLARQREELVEKKEQLDQQYEELLEEKEALESSRKEMSDEAEIKTYNQKVQALNEKINQYHEKESALKTKIEAYNKRIREQ